MYPYAYVLDEEIIAAVIIGDTPIPKASPEVYIENPRGKIFSSKIIGKDPIITVTAPLSHTPNKIKPRYAIK